MACSESVIDSSGVAGNLILASAIRNGSTSFLLEKSSRPSVFADQSDSSLRASRRVRRHFIADEAAAGRKSPQVVDGLVRVDGGRPRAEASRLRRVAQQCLASNASESVSGMVASWPSDRPRQRKIPEAGIGSESATIRPESAGREPPVGTNLAGGFLRPTRLPQTPAYSQG